MKSGFPNIYPITDDSIADVSLYEQFVGFVEAGAAIVQLRAKRATSAELYSAGHQISADSRRKCVKLIINDRVDIALAVGADGIHLGQTDMPPIDARRLLGKDAIIGYSTHNVEQIRTALKLPIDYVAIGPVFPTNTKSDTDPVIGLEMVREVRSVVGDMPLVAIGGISIQNAANVLTAGADSVAVISALLKDGRIGDRFAKLASAIAASANNVQPD